MDTRLPGSEKVDPSPGHHTYTLFIFAALRFSGSKHGHDLSADLVMVRVQPLFHATYPMYFQGNASSPLGPIIDRPLIGDS